MAQRMHPLGSPIGRHHLTDSGPKKRKHCRHSEQDSHQRKVQAPEQDEKPTELPPEQRLEPKLVPVAEEEPKQEELWWKE